MTLEDIRLSEPSDAIAAADWLLTTGLAIWTGWKWGRRLFPADGWLESIGHALLLFWAGVVAIATLLGLAHLLTGALLLVSGLAVSLAALVGLSRSRLPAERAIACRSGRVRLVGAVGTSADVLDWPRRHVRLVGVSERLGLAGVSSAARRPVAADARPPCHGLRPRWANPGNNELLTLWAVAPFSGDFLAALTNLTPAVILAASTVSVATRFGLPRGVAHVAGFAAVCTFVVLKQLVDSENDVAVAACFFAVLSYAVRIGNEPSGRLALFAAIGLGLLVGVKYYALGYALLALTAWLVLSMQAGDPWLTLRHACCGVLGMAALGGYWYARNLVLTGSPIFPKGLTSDTDLLMQIYPEVRRTSFVGNGSPELLPLYFRAVWSLTGPCQYLGVLMAPLSLLWLVATGIRVGRREGWRRGIAAASLRLSCWRERRRYSSSRRSPSRTGRGR